MERVQHVLGLREVRGRCRALLRLGERRESQQMLNLFVLQRKSLPDPDSDLVRGVALPSLLKSRVVVGADTGKHRDFVPAQTGHLPVPATGQLVLLR